MSLFAVQSLYAEDRRVETTTFELTPSHEQAQRVCGVLREFLAHRPPEFRDKLSFLNQGDLELEWAASESGVAFASIYNAGNPATFLLLLSGKDAEADRGMYDGFLGSMVRPLMGELELPQQSRPLLLMLLAPGAPELTPLLQLLATSLASVYFRALAEKHAH